MFEQYATAGHRADIDQDQDGYYWSCWRCDATSDEWFSTNSEAKVDFKRHVRFHEAIDKQPVVTISALHGDRRAELTRYPDGWGWTDLKHSEVCAARFDTADQARSDWTEWIHEWFGA